MDVVIVAIFMSILMLVLIAVNWVLSDKYRELLKKNKAATEEIIRLQQRNYYLEAENKRLEGK